MKVIISLIMCVLPLILLSVIRTVSLDGTQQYTVIQTAIISSASGDSIIVYPGTYYENINYSGKNITIASLELTTGNPAYRDSTIIDGNNNGSCVRVETNENNAAIYGFIIQHGSGTPYMLWGANIPKGGGIRLRNALNFTVQNCLIKDNKASGGGGINAAIGSINLINTIIRNNYASIAGGGILFEGGGRAVFDSNERCSVYENYAGLVNDISAADSGYIMDVYLDVFTVNPPTDYYIYYSKSSPSWPGYFSSINVQQGFRTEVNHDLYLSPTGDDTNDGFSPSTPLKSIAVAFHTIASDSLNPKTIYLAPGTYSSQGGQLFPISMKAYVNLYGDMINPPIILNQDFPHTIYSYFAPGKTVANLIIEHGDNHPINVFELNYSDNTVISNIAINPVQASSNAGLNIMNSICDVDNIRLNGLISNIISGIAFFCSEGSIRNCSINDCHAIGGESFPVFSIIYANLDSIFVVENVSVTNCSVTNPENSVISIAPNQYANPSITLNNVLVANCTSVGESPIIIGADTISEVTNLTNCSFINNSGTNIAMKIVGNANITNCIFDNYNPTEIEVKNTLPYGFISNMLLRNNLIRGYPSSMYVHPTNNVTFNEINFDADPGFAGTDWTDPLSYRLNYNSPCIDAGTQDTTGLFLPDFDLYGNIRIFNNRVDIGCNEWDGTGNEDEQINPVLTESQLQIRPNPFRCNTIIRYTIGDAGSGMRDGKSISAPVDISVYNLKGQKIKNITHKPQAKGVQVTYWDGRDDQGKACSSGIYLVNLTVNGKQISSKKVTLVR